MANILPSSSRCMWFARYLKRFLVVTVILIGVFSVFVSIRLHFLAKQLVHNIKDVAKDMAPRSVHTTDPIPGTFGDALAPHIPALVANAKAIGDKDKGLAVAILMGYRSVKYLSPIWKDALSETRPAWRGVLLATHTKFATPPEATNSMADYVQREQFNSQFSGDFYKGIVNAAYLIGLDIREQLLIHNAKAAVEECLDGLALARDLSYGGTVSQGFGKTVIKILSASCTAAFDAAPISLMETAIHRLQAIRNAMPRPSEVARRRKLVLETYYFGSLLAGSIRKQIPQKAQALLRQSFNPTTTFDKLVIWIGWPNVSDRYERLSPFWDLPRLQRENKLSNMYFFDLGRLAAIMIMDIREQQDIYLIALTSLDMLQAAVWMDIYYAQHGSRPASISQAMPPGSNLIALCTGLPFAVNGNQIQAVCPVTNHLGHQDKPEELEIKMHPDNVAEDR